MRKKAKTANSTEKLSIIICTLGRYEDLQHCIDALEPSLQNSKYDYEVLVIDQNPIESRRKLHTPYIKQIFQDELGLSVGRNLGISIARFDLIAFLDDDAVPCTDWVEQVCGTFARDAERKFCALGGRVDPDWRHGQRPTWMNESLERYLSCINWSDSPRLISASEYIVGANMVFRRQVFNDYGVFDPSLGRKGDASLLSNEEISLIKKIGHDRIIYNPFAQAYHIIQRPRFKQDWFRKRVYWQAISDLIGNTVWMSLQDARDRLSEFMLSCPAELRTVNGFNVDFHDEKMMSRQMNAIYALVIIGSHGFPVKNRV